MVIRAPIARNVRQKMSGYTMLRSLQDECAALAIFDPQYRAVLNKLKFGNEGARQKKRSELPQMSDYDISIFMQELERVLRPSGHIAFWMDKYTIASGHHLRYFQFCSWLRLVDMLCWDTQRFGMGRRLRCTTEYLLIIQKEPTRAKECWMDHSIRDSWSEASDREAHPHAKPAALTRRLILSTTRPGDLVVDPCAGSYMVLDVCKKTKRTFIGCDLIGGDE